MQKYSVTTEVDPFPMIPAFGDDLLAAIADGNRAQPDAFLPEIPWVNRTARFTAPRKELLRAVQSAIGYVPRRTPKAILTNVKLSINGAVELVATDCEIAGTVCQHFERTGELTGLVNAKQLESTLKRMNAVDVDVTLTESDLTISGAGSAATIPVNSDGNPDEFPVVATSIVDPVCSVNVEAADLVAAIQAVEHAADSESTRYALGGVYFELTPGSAQVYVVATDTRRLSMTQFTGEIVKAPEKQFGLVLPLAFCRALVKSLDYGLVRLSFAALIPAKSDSDCDFPGAATAESLADGSAFYCRAVAGRFPKFRDVIPNDKNLILEFDRGAALDAIDAVQHCSTCEAVGSEFNFETPADGFGAGTVQLVCGIAATGIAKASFPGDFTAFCDREKLPAGITLDAFYVRDYLRTLPKGTRLNPTRIALRIIDGESAVVFSPIGSAGATEIIMPLSRDR